MPDSTTPSARFRATIEYDGTAFYGSQLQPGVRTVQGALEKALHRLFQQPEDRPVRIHLAGRTDTGVHAAAQELAFDAPPRWVAPELHRALNAVLPSDVAIFRLRETTCDFHPRFDARARRYEYVVEPGGYGNPFLRDRVWELDREPDLELLSDMAARVPGERSFAGFAKTGQPRRGTGCAVKSAEWVVGPGTLLRFRICADRFLHHMVRYMVRTLIEIATDRRPSDDFALMLKAETPSRPMSPAPPSGLYLTGVRYAEGWNRSPAVSWLDWPPADGD